MTRQLHKQTDDHASARNEVDGDGPVLNGPGRRYSWQEEGLPQRLGPLEQFDQAANDGAETGGG
jgi:hypothetical protein